MVKQFDDYKSFREIIMTKNDAAFPDVKDNGEVKDELRKTYQ